MSNQIKLKLKSVQYTGDSIGHEVRLDIKVLQNDPVTIEQTIKPGSTFEFNKEIANFEPKNSSFGITLNVKVTEKDLISESGEKDRTIKVDANKTEIQKFEVEVPVRERRKIILKSTAIFKIIFEAEPLLVSNSENIPKTKLKFYKSPIKGQDLNRYDNDILVAVDFWNHEFSNQDHPPQVLLDPDLVKAIVYVESSVGYLLGEKNKDVMQVGHTDDPALHTLNNDDWISPATGKVAKENEWQNGEVIMLDYNGKANAGTVEESIKWGVRWLYHKAQTIDGNKRIWRDWKEAVKRYGPGTKEYQDIVWNIYTKGLAQRGIKLWSLLLIPIVPAIILAGFMGLNQGKIFMTFEDYPGTEDYGVRGRVVNGFWYDNVYVSKVYANAGNFLALDRNRPINIEYIDIDNDSSKEIVVTGSYITDSTTKYIIKKFKGKYKIVDVWHEEAPVPDEAVNSQLVSLKDINNDKILEIVTDYLILYENALNVLLTTYYKYDKDTNSYRFDKEDKVNTAQSELANGYRPTLSMSSYSRDWK